MQPARIPLHDFTRDDHRSIPFRVMPLEYREEYDTSVPHRHNYYEIFLFEEGGGYHDIDFHGFEIAGRSVHFVSPGQVHLVRRELNTRGAVIFFSRDFYYLNLQNKNILFELPFLNNNSARPILNLESSDFQPLLDLSHKMADEFASKHDFREELIRSYLNIFLIESRRLFSESRPHMEGSHAAVFRQFRILLEENFARLHQVQDYARLIPITEKQLNEVCKRSTGKTASELIHERIILEAKRLLTHSALNNKEVAHFLNFDDPSHFSKFFKRKTGETPSGFRKSIRERYAI
jgi:AraC family transcriptional activator of pobA